MGLVREPDGVDFIISGGHLTPEESHELSEFFRNLKREQSTQAAAISGSNGDHLAKLPAGNGSEQQPQPLTSLSH